MTTPNRLQRAWPDEDARKREEARSRRYFLVRGFAPEKVEAILRKREATWHRFRILHEEQVRTRAQYGALFAEIQAILARHDPLGIIWPNDPPEIRETEYDRVVGTLLPRLPGAQTLADVRRIVPCEEFERWLWAGVTDEPHRRERFRGMPEALLEAWNRYQPQYAPMRGRCPGGEHLKTPARRE